MAWNRFRTHVRSHIDAVDYDSDPLILITNISAILGITTWFVAFACTLFPSSLSRR